jgi:Predicted transcriptional regulators
MPSIREEIAKNIRFHRKKNDYTQKDLAKKLGVTASAISNWETGDNSIDIDTLVLICDLFQVTLNDMYGVYCDSDGLPRDPDEKKPLVYKNKELSETELAMIAVFQQIPEDKQKEFLDSFEALLRASGAID